MSPLFSSDPYSAFATYGILPTYQSPVLKWSSTTLNIATNNATHYNTSTGKYCPDHRGTYLFQLHLYKMSPTGGPSCTIIKESQSGSLASISRVFSSGSTLGGSTATIVELKQGDCVWVGACDDLLHISDLTSFSGALLDLLD